MSSVTPRRRRPVRVVIGVIAALLIGLVIVVALLPTLAGFGPGRRMVASAIGDALETPVTIDRLSLSWFGRQEIDGLRADAADGTRVLDLDVSIDRSLVAVLRGGWSDATITVDGLAHVRRAADGSVGIAGQRTASTGGAAPSAPSSGSQPGAQEPVRLPVPLDMTLLVGALDLRYSCAQQGLDLRLPDLSLTAHLRTASPITATLQSAVESEGQRGSVRGDITVDRAIAADGTIDLASALIETDLLVERVRATLGPDTLDLHRLQLKASTSDLAQGLDATLIAKGQLSGTTGMAVDSDLRMRLDMPEGDWLRSEVTLGGTLDAIMLAAVTQIDAVIPTTTAPSGQPTSSEQVAHLGPAGATTATSATRPALFPEGLDATLRLEGLALTFADDAAGRRVVARDLVGIAVAGTVRPIHVELRGGTEFEEVDEAGERRITRAGRFDLTADARDLVDAMGVLQLDGAAVNVAAIVEGVVIPLQDRVVEIARLEANVDAADLTESMQMRITGDAMLDGSTQSTVRVDLHADRPVSASGELALRPDRLRGEVLATNLPLALLEPILLTAMPDSPLVLRRDLGERVDARITLPGGGDTAAAEMTTERMTLTASGRTSVEEAIQIDTLSFDWRMPVELLDALGIPVADEASVRVRGSQIRVPLSDDAPALARAAANLSLELGNPVTLRDADGAVLLVVDALRTTIATTALASGVDLAVDGMIDGATLTARQRLTGLLDASGALSADTAVATGDLRLEGMSRERLLERVPADSRALVASIVSRAPVLTVQTGGDAERRTASIAADVGRATLASELALAPETLHLSSTVLTLIADDAILGALLEEPERPRLVSAAPIAVTVAPAALPTELLTDIDRLLREGPPLEIRVAAERMTFRQAAAPATVGVHDLRATAKVLPGESTGMTLDLTTSIRSDDAPAGMIKVDARATRRDGEIVDPTGSISATGLSVAALERLAGSEPAAWSNWLGATGDLVAEARSVGDTLELMLRPSFAQLVGELRASVTEQTITMPEGTITLNLPKEQIDRLLGPAEGAPPSDEPALRALGGMRSQLSLSQIVIDRGLFTDDGPVDPRRTRGSVRIDAEPLTLTLGTERIEVRDLKATLVTDALPDGVRLTAAAGRSGQPAEGASRDAVLSVNATLRSLTDAAGRLNTDTATIDADIAAEAIPTAVLDRMAALNGRLVAALGPMISASLRSQALSRTAGTLSGKLTSANGFIDLPRVVSRDGALRVEPAAPIRAELALSPPLRRELLHGINPILADLRTVDQPIRATVSSAVVPLDGNMRGLMTDALVTIGRMELDSGSAIVTLLDLAGAQEGRQLAGLIDPFNLRVRSGNLTYDDLTLKLGMTEGAYRFELLFKGDVDLAAAPPFARAITTRLPASGLARSIREVPTAVGRLHVDVVYSGPLYSSEGDPRALKRDLKFGGDVGGIVEDLLGDLLRR